MKKANLIRSLVLLVLGLVAGGQLSAYVAQISMGPTMVLVDERTQGFIKLDDNRTAHITIMPDMDDAIVDHFNHVGPNELRKTSAKQAILCSRFREVNSREALTGYELNSTDDLSRCLDEITRKKIRDFLLDKEIISAPDQLMGVIVYFDYIYPSNDKAVSSIIHNFVENASLHKVECADLKREDDSRRLLPLRGVGETYKLIPVTSGPGNKSSSVARENQSSSSVSSRKLSQDDDVQTAYRQGDALKEQREKFSLRRPVAAPVVGTHSGIKNSNVRRISAVKLGNSGRLPVGAGATNEEIAARELAEQNRRAAAYREHIAQERARIARENASVLARINAIAAEAALRQKEREQEERAADALSVGDLTITAGLMQTPPSTPPGSMPTTPAPTPITKLRSPLTDGSPSSPYMTTPGSGSVGSRGSFGDRSVVFRRNGMLHSHSERELVFSDGESDEDMDGLPHPFGVDAQFGGVASDDDEDEQ